jgi:hypothetical protein
MRRKFYGAVAAASALSLIGGGIALADNVVNKLDTSIDPAFETMTLTAGGATGSTGIYIQPTQDTGETAAQCNVGGSNPDLKVAVASSNTSVATVTSSVTFSNCGDTNTARRTITVTPVSAGTANITFAKASENTNTKTFDFTTAQFTVQVNAAPVTAVAPTVTPNINASAATAGSTGWYKAGTVGLRWTITGTPTPTVNPGADCGTKSINTDGEHSFTCAVTNSAGSASDSATIKRDATPPVISGSDVNDANWRNMDLSQKFTSSDGTSGLANAADAAFTLTASADSVDANTPTTVDKTVVDNAGNSSRRTLSALIDKTPPVNTVTGVGNGATYTLGVVPSAGCTTADALSGAATQATASTSGGPVGSVTTTCSGGKDNAGNTAVDASATYTVAYAFGSFKAPVNALPTRNMVKAGLAVPVKFDLGGNQGLSIFAGNGPTSTSAICSTTTPSDPVEDTMTAGSSSLKYDEVSGTYNYVWKTDAAWAGKCRTFSLNLKDGSTHSVSFTFTK